MAAPNKVQKKAAIQWSRVDQTQIIQEKLQLLIPASKALLKDGYVLRQPSEEEIWKKMRCQNCGQKLKRFRPVLPHENISEQEQDLLTFDTEEQDYAHQSGDLTVEDRYTFEVAQAASSSSNQRHACLFHDGQTFNGVWQCCGGRANTKGCCSNIDHITGDLNELRAEWLFHKTPIPIKAPAQKIPAPGISPSSQGRARRGRGWGRYTNSYQPHSSPLNNHNSNTKSIRSVVALDCEMGTSRLGNVILIRVSLIDFFTQESLIDSLVAPTVEMAHYNTRYSGVTFSAMRNAIRTNTAIRGTDAARNEVFKYIDSNTIVIVHGGNGDFTSLRWIHPASRIIDTCILEGYDYKVKDMGWRKGLKEVCARRCGIVVQDAKLENGRIAGHDSLEDAFATREIVCAWLRMIPDA